MRVTIIGAGISGLVTAGLLRRRHPITMFEAGDDSCRHTSTVDAEREGERHAIDTRFIVFNERTDPNFRRLHDLHCSSRLRARQNSDRCIWKIMGRTRRKRFDDGGTE